MASFLSGYSTTLRNKVVNSFARGISGLVCVRARNLLFFWGLVSSFQWCCSLSIVVVLTSKDLFDLKLLFHIYFNLFFSYTICTFWPVSPFSTPSTPSHLPSPPDLILLPFYFFWSLLVSQVFIIIRQEICCCLPMRDSYSILLKIEVYQNSYLL